MPAFDDFKRVLLFFNSLKKESLIEDFAIVGGLALSAWIEPRTTGDIDLAVTISSDIQNKDLIYLVESRLSKKTHKPKMRPGSEIKNMFSFTEGNFGVDIISTKDFLLAAEAVSNAVEIEIMGEPVKVATPEYLIALKLIPLGDQDKVDIKNLLKVTNMLQVKKIARKYGLLELFNSLLKH